MIEATLFGKPLPDGGTIGVVAAASPHEGKSDVYRGVEWWESHGYEVKLADGVWAIDDYTAGDRQRRADDLNALFADPEVDVVQVLQGGYGSAQLIPYIDFDVIAANPKPFIGYSDITALHVAIRQRTGLATLYGYGLAGMGYDDSTPFSLDRLLEVLRTGGTGEVPRDPDDPYVRAISPGKVTAPLVGGCFWLLDPDPRHAVGVRARRSDPLLRGREAPAVLPRRLPQPAPGRGKAPAGGGRRRRGDEGLRLRGPARVVRVAALPDARGRARAITWSRSGSRSSTSSRSGTASTSLHSRWGSLYARRRHAKPDRGRARVQGVTPREAEMRKSWAAALFLWRSSSQAVDRARAGRRAARSAWARARESTR